MNTTDTLKTFGKWMAPKQDCSITAIHDIPLQDVLKMFGPANQVGVKNPYTKPAQPVQYMRQTFSVTDEPLKNAELFITAHGLYEAYLNGHSVTDTYLNPGFTSYDSFLEYQTFNVTDLFKPNLNCIAFKLADGWYKGKYGLMAFGGNYGKQTSLIFCLKVETVSGNIYYIGSNEDMVSSTGAEICSDFLEGEIFDARKEPVGWKEALFNDSDWLPCHEDLTYACKNLQPDCAEPVRAIETLPVKQIFTTPKGETILDFGTNIAGFVKMKPHGERGNVIRLDHFEVLDKDGNYYNSIFGYDRNQCVLYTCNGNESDWYYPSFTFFGFRYVKISGVSTEIHLDDFSAVVLSSDLPTAGSFCCSNNALNKLQDSIVRSQKGNFISIPTDCPQRERAGWTGDVLVYCDTALFNQNGENFFKRWLKSVNADQLSNGEIPIVVPYVNGYKYFQKPLMGSDSSSGWGDVIIHLPWSLYQEYGDIHILEEQFPYMKKWMDYVEHEACQNGSTQSDDNYLWNTGFHFGDWLYPSSKDKNGNTEMMDGDFCTTQITATVFFALDAQIMAQICTLLGNKQLQDHYSELNHKIQQAFRKAYVSHNGEMTVNLQGMYVLALAGNMLEEEVAEKAAAHLNKLISENNYCLDTGFMSIKYLMDVLHAYGYNDTARKLLYQTNCPSWLYEINHGATTIWETWDAIRADGNATPVSYNHYAFGCIGDWMYRQLLGLKRLTPGWTEFEISPVLHFNLDFAQGYHLINGKKIKFRWAKDSQKLTYTLHVPKGCTAKVPLPDNCYHYMTLNNKQMAATSLSLSAGDFHITYLLDHRAVADSSVEI